VNEYIAYCGLDCEACEARTATVNNDDVLRKKVAALWSELNGIEITPEMINCAGCKIEGAKCVFCDSLCRIRKCAVEKGYATCGECRVFETCEKAAMILGDNAEALERLRRISAEKNK
jgi:hypothetical protein